MMKQSARYLWNAIDTAPDYPIDVFFVNGTWSIPVTGILRRAVKRDNFWEELDTQTGVPAQFVILWKDTGKEGPPTTVYDLDMLGSDLSTSKSKSRPELKLVK